MPLRRTAAAAVVAAVALLGAGCGGSTVTDKAPVLTVVTGLWPFAVAARAIGLGNVKVVDPVPAKDDPRRWTPDSSARRSIAGAGVVLEAGGGFQPGFEAAARANRATVALVGRAAPGATEVWLDPYGMEAVGRRIAAAFEAADPKAAPTFRTGLADWLAEVGALDASYESTLSVCTTHRLVAVDAAFGVLAARYDVEVTPLVDTVAPLGLPSSATVQAEVRVLRAAHTTRVYSDPRVPTSYVIEALAVTGAHVAGTLNTLIGTPTSGPSTYDQAMALNLTDLTKALACPDDSTT